MRKTFLYCEKTRVWFDKLTMREGKDCRELYSATFGIGLAAKSLPSW
jgi:hypothetical protein